jgi:hypothetical protein
MTYSHDRVYGASPAGARALTVRIYVQENQT